MPTYTYKCTSGHEFELRQGFEASPVEVCPTCQSQARRRIYSPAVIYKGSGFYTTDYARKNLVPAGESSNGHSGEPSSANGKSAENGHEHGHDHGHSHAEAGGTATPAT